MARRDDKKADPDETVTYLPPPSVPGARVLALAAGCALAAQHVLTGLLATPFFGSEAFFWANVLGAFLLSAALGFALGDKASTLVGGAPRGPWRLLGLGSALVTLATWALPVVARAMLDRDPDSPLAPAATLLPVLVLPGFFLAAVVPASIPGVGAPIEPGKNPIAVAHLALRRFSLALLGGVLGLALVSYGLLHAEKAKVWAQLMGLGAGFVALAAFGLGRVGRVLAAVTLAVTAGLVFGRPSEIQSPEFEAALSDEAVLHGAGRYYARTADEHVLTGTELERKLGIAERRLQGADKKIAVLLVVETVKTMGPLNISGKGLKNLLDIYLPRESKPLILPFVDKIKAVHSDGHLFRFKIEREQDGRAHFKVPGASEGELQEFAINDDFDLEVTSEGPNDRVTKLTIGPQKVEPGLIHDTITTPLVCKNVALWIDASLLSITIDNQPQEVLLKASAQASVGAVQTKLLQSIDKAKVR